MAHCCEEEYADGARRGGRRSRRRIEGLNWTIAAGLVRRSLAARPGRGADGLQPKRVVGDRQEDRLVVGPQLRLVGGGDWGCGRRVVPTLRWRQAVLKEVYLGKPLRPAGRDGAGVRTAAQAH
jgi:hypothetical protein